MKMNQILGLAAAVALTAGSSVAMAGGHEGGPEITGEGSCVYVQENMFAGPFDVCQEPVGPESCAELGQTDDNRDATHSAEACANSELIGTCVVGNSKVHYFMGENTDPSTESGGLEIGCGFQGGDWEDPA
ncbi:MAG: hypothetical protein ACR2QG_10290 [Gammaproteobacteria bacterium]